MQETFTQNVICYIILLLTSVFRNKSSQSESSSLNRRLLAAAGDLSQILQPLGCFLPSQAGADDSDSAWRHKQALVVRKKKVAFEGFWRYVFDATMYDSTDNVQKGLVKG